MRRDKNSFLFVVLCSDTFLLVSLLGIFRDGQVSAVDKALRPLVAEKPRYRAYGSSPFGPPPRLCPLSNECPSSEDIKRDLLVVVCVHILPSHAKVKNTTDHDHVSVCSTSLERA